MAKKTPERPERNPPEASRSGMYRTQVAKGEEREAQAKAEAEQRRQDDAAENKRTDDRVDEFAKLTIDNMKVSHATSLGVSQAANDSKVRQLRVAAVMIFFLVGIIVVLAGRSLDFSIGADGLKFDGGGNEAEATD